MAEKIGYDIENSLGRLLGLASQFMRLGLNRKFAGAGHEATSEQWQILITLWAENGLTQKQIAERSYKNKVSVVKLIDGLERRGLVNRLPDPGDRRSNRIFLTSKGKSVQEDLIALSQKNLDQAANGINPVELTICIKVLKQIITNMKGDTNGND